MPTIIVKRKFTLTGSLVPFKVFVNDHHIGTIINGDSQLYDINDVGKLVVQLRWTGPGKGSPELVIDNVQSEDTISLFCRVKRGIFLNSIVLEQEN
jgi:hypothetical protein